MIDLFENEKKPEVSVIIPAYRPGIKFERLLKKIQKQSYPVKDYCNEYRKKILEHGLGVCKSKFESVSY